MTIPREPPGTTPPPSTPGTRGRQIAVLFSACAVTALAAGVVLSSLTWVGRTFPGFFLMDNLVVPSVGLGHWTGLQGETIYQRPVGTVDDRVVADAQAVYDRVAAEPPGTPFRYRFGSGALTDTITIPSMQFGWTDYLSVFGALLLNGVIFSAVGLAVWIFGPGSATALGTIALTLNLGLFCLTAMDLYGPAQLFRLHAATEALIPATLLHLMLVFPFPRLVRHRVRILVAAYLADLALIAVYQHHLYTPAAYSEIHNFCMTMAGIIGVGLIASGVHAYLTSTSPLVQQRLRVIALGVLIGFALPAWVLTSSGLYGGDQALNLAAFTAFLFPLSLAYAVIKHDLFEIDAMLRRAISYLLVTGVIGATYVAVVLGSGLILHTRDLAGSQAFPLVFSLFVIAFFNPLRGRIQRAVDRLHHRTPHDAQKTLELASAALVATLDTDDIYDLTLDTICDALFIDEASLWMTNGDGQFGVVHARGVARFFRGTLARDHPLVRQLEEGARAVSIYDFADGGQGDPHALTCQRTLQMLSAELVLPIGRADVTGFIALGRKKSGAIFTLDDLGFLTTFANQAAVAIRNAQAYRKIEELNLDLEHKVAQRTSELAKSLEDLERAYGELQHSQEKLVRSEKMAALGRLTAGIAHEVNTPLGAALNSLRMVEDLVTEYASSIGDASVNQEDHRQLAGELRELVGNVSKWTTKAAGYIRSIKAHTRSVEGRQERSFDLVRLVEDTHLLLAHRLRLSSCTLTLDGPPSVILYGDPGKLGQVLTNLITNAVDAYEERGSDGAVRVRIQPRPRHVDVAVEDDGCGIAPEHLERIFEELFTTKPPGKGTGLGLAICRDIVAECFNGRIDVTSTVGKGSCFTLRLLRRVSDAETDEPPVAEARG